MQNMLIVVILVATLASCCLAEPDNEQLQRRKQSREAVRVVLNKKVSVPETVVYQQLSVIGRNYSEGPVANIVGRLIDMAEMSEANCLALNRGSYQVFVEKFRGRPLGRYVEAKSGQLRIWCKSLHEQKAFEKFPLIVSQLDNDDKLKTLVSFVDKLEPTIKASNPDGRVPFENLLKALDVPNDKQLVGAVLDQCHEVYIRLKQLEKIEHMWAKIQQTSDELGKKWLTHYSVCKTLVGDGEGLGHHIIQVFSSFQSSIQDSSLTRFGDFLESVPEQVALSRTAEIPEKVAAGKVVDYVFHRLSATTDENLRKLFNPNKSGPQKMKEELEVLKNICKQLSEKFEPLFWMLEAGAKLDKSNMYNYMEQVGALKVARVCGHLPSMNYDEEILRWYPAPVAAPAKETPSEAKANVEPTKKPDSKRVPCLPNFFRGKGAKGKH